MKQSTLLFAVLGLSAITSCATTPTRSSTQCAVREIQEVVRDAVGHDGEIFCGEVFVVLYDRTARILSRPDEMPPSNDLALLVTTDSRRLLIGLSTEPRLFYVEARIDPDVECFPPTESEEDCSPYVRPVVMHILFARRRP